MDSPPEVITKEEGLRLLKEGEIDAAIKVLEKVRQNVDDAQACSYLGAAYCQKGDRPRAIRAFEEALRIQETPKAYFNLAVMYESVSRMDEAVREYRMAAELDPEYAPAQQAIQRLQAQFAAAQPEHETGLAEEIAASGVIDPSIANPPEPELVDVQCPVCLGKGKQGGVFGVGAKDCENCKGAGSVKVPAP
ncbi:MAG: tetratricopeptide repeat protein [Armatimonadetes bacterium]|jgi:tetratricopeptide (TPR) repeat protein|nr:tetratricopeptide repeat protein [Armatimonadota bacterium]